jgi:hypothetical protein
MTSVYAPGGSVATMAQSPDPAVGGKAPTRAMTFIDAGIIPKRVVEASAPVAIIGPLLQPLLLAIGLEFPS